MRRIPVSTLAAAAGRLLVALLFGGALLAGTHAFGQSSQANSRCVQAGGTTKLPAAAHQRILRRGPNPIVPRFIFHFASFLTEFRSY